MRWPSGSNRGSAVTVAAHDLAEHLDRQLWCRPRHARRAARRTRSTASSEYPRPPLDTRPTTVPSPSRTGSLPSATDRGSSSTRHTSRDGPPDGAGSAPSPRKSSPSAHGEPEPRRVRVGLARDVGAPDPVALLEPQRVDGAVAAGHQPERPAGVEQRVPQPHAVLDRRIQLPAELADVRDAQRPARDVADGDRRGPACTRNVRSSAHTADRTSRAAGPHNAKHAIDDVTSRTITDPSVGACCSIHERS